MFPGRLESNRPVSDSLLKRVAAGEMAAMQECIAQYGGLVWSLARRFSGSNSDAEDAVQEVFVALWKSADRFDESKGSETTFVAMIARRRLIDERRKVQRQANLVERAMEQTTIPPPRDDVEMADEAKHASTVLAELSREQQRVLQLSIHHGLTQEQIAEHTGLPLGTVKTHIRRGLIRVREKLANLAGQRGAEVQT
ncbi:MAG: RNA polymerase sigma factor [Planctomycetota bacterium]